MPSTSSVLLAACTSVVGSATLRGAGAVAARAHHWPATACPLTCPGLLSPANVYSGQPAYVNCVVPSARVIVPNAPLTPGTAIGAVIPEGTSSGGQYFAHPPVHALLLPAVSFVNM